MTKKEMKEMVTSQYSQNKDTKLIERVACYIRVSSEEQKLHGISLDSQRDKLREYAEKHNLKIVDWYEDEGVSGRKLIRKRPALQRMIHDAQAGKFDRIIFIKLDRFFRSTAEYHECMKLISPVIWTATEEKYDLTTANGRLLVNMKINIAELEADQTSERIKLVNEYKVKEGRALTGKQALTIGYTTATIDGVIKVVKDSETADMVMEFINHFLEHQNKRQAFLYASEKYNSPYGYAAFGHILKDTKIYGHYRGNDNYCEPYVDKQTFDRIQEILAKNIKIAPSGTIYLFSGLMKCPECGRNLASRKCERKNKSKPKSEWIYYRCNYRNRENKCNFNAQLKEPEIEQYLLNSFDSQIKVHLENVKVKNDQAVDNGLYKKIESVKKEMTRLNNMYRKERITEAEYDKEYEELERKLKEMESQLEPVEERDVTIYEELLKSDWKDLYIALNKENRRVFWRKYIKEIKIAENGSIEGIIFF